MKNKCIDKMFKILLVIKIRPGSIGIYLESEAFQARFSLLPFRSRYCRRIPPQL